MKVNSEDMRLYVVTDRMWLGENSLVMQVEKAVKAGATFVQLREKNLGFDDFLKNAREIKIVTDKYKVPFVINDNVEVALAVDADGVHVGQSDLEAKNVRKLIGENKILGVSAHTVEQALKAQESGADYIGVGAVFTTTTKGDADSVTFDMLREICSAVSIPVVAIGGITKDNIMKLSGSGVDGVAVISAIFSHPDIEGATRKLLELSNRMVS